MGIRLLVNGDISMGNAYSYWEKNFRHFDWVMFNSKVLNLSGITIWKNTEKNNMYQYEINDRGVESLKPRTKPEESKSERTVAT